MIFMSVGEMIGSEVLKSGSEGLSKLDMDWKRKMFS